MSTTTAVTLHSETEATERRRATRQAARSWTATCPCCFNEYDGFTRAEANARQKEMDARMGDNRKLKTQLAVLREALEDAESGLAVAQRGLERAQSALHSYEYSVNDSQWDNLRHVVEASKVATHATGVRARAAIAQIKP